MKIMINFQKYRLGTSFSIAPKSFGFFLSWSPELVLYSGDLITLRYDRFFNQFPC